MNKFEQKLRQNRNRRRREKLLACVDNSMKAVLEHVEFSSDVNVIGYAAFATWSDTLDDWTTTRGELDNWEKRDFGNWSALISDLKIFTLSGDIMGWLFFDTDGPYYQVRLKEVYGLLDELAQYVSQHNHYEFGWVSSEIDAGLIVEFEHTSFCKNDFSLCVWGLNQ